MQFDETKDTRYAKFALKRDSKAKKAGSNRLAITTRSDDWRASKTTVNMTLREARTLKDFLNKHLDHSNPLM